MNLGRLSTLHSFLNRKIGMSSQLGTMKIIAPNEKEDFFDTLSALASIKNTLVDSKLKVTNMNDNTFLTASPLVINDEYADPTSLYKKILRYNLQQFPIHARESVIDIINIVATSASLPMNRVRYGFLRLIAEHIFAHYPTLPKKIRVKHISDVCQAYVFGNRFLFLTFGDTGVPRDPQGHIDLFGFDLFGVIENYVNGFEMHPVGFKLPTMLRFRNTPVKTKMYGGAVLVETLEKPIKHHWVEVRSSRSYSQEIVTLDFNSIAQTYVNEPANMLTDTRWNAIKKMIKFEGEHG